MKRAILEALQAARADKRPVALVTNLESLSQLTEVLSRPVTRRQEAASEWLEAG